ncbi:hypothetical protein [Streptomyces enissocaesilis]|uniref:Uncharacterized protein n=1 Tax=Streptomyces enissocaesilis TaxID=332589 RepID=A0ABN3X730_9ACTN
MSQRTGITKFVGNVLEEAKDFADSVLDRTRDLEHDLRNAVSKPLKPTTQNTAPPPASPHAASASAGVSVAGNAQAREDSGLSGRPGSPVTGGPA